MGKGSLAALRGKHVVCLPDFFLDVVVRLGRWTKARRDMDRIGARGGGNLLVPPVEFRAGGNATNTAVALARLGAKVDLIADTDPLGRAVLERAAHASGLGLSHVRIVDTGPVTVALESSGANVMLSHSGPVRDFGPRRLTRAAWRAIERADAVVLANWAQNRRGTQLVRAVAPRAARAGAFVYVDTADPRHRGVEARTLAADRHVWDAVGAWGMNENELRAFTGDQRGALVPLAKRLAQDTGVVVDLHTRRFAVTTDGSSVTRVLALSSKSRRLTGAGDAWNAGNVAGHLVGMDARDRLRLAHRVATSFVTGASGLPPTAAQV